MTELRNILDMQNLSPVEFRGLDRNRTVAVVPFGPIEYHGDHLPLGTDYFQAGDLFRGAAERFAGQHPEWKFLFLPVIPLGADAVPHGGTLMVGRRVIRDVSESVARQFIGYGFRHVALVSGHGGLTHISAMDDAARTLNLRFRGKKARVFVPLNYMLTQLSTDRFKDALNAHLAEPLGDADVRQMLHESHGGRFETSYIMAVRPDLVDDTYKTADDHTPRAPAILKAVLDALARIIPGSKGADLALGAETLAIATDWLRKGAARGYMGYPSQASAETGNAFREACMAVFGDLLEIVCINGKLPRDGMDLFLALKLIAG